MLAECHRNAQGLILPCLPHLRIPGEVASVTAEHCLPVLSLTPVGFVAQPVTAHGHRGVPL